MDAYAVGDIHLSTSSTNPSARFGGTWERFGKGRTLVSVDEGDSALSTSSKTGGSTNPLTEHNHPLKMIMDGGNIGATTHKYGIKHADSTNWRSGDLGTLSEANDELPSSQSGGIAKTKGNNADHANWQPFITVYMWVKTV
ncbi:hypothetical protein GU333_04300 [Lactococcus raffinolactis]|uniref:phage baseplate protein n=1 Tax=Pseudolactococcus raffinolactis TaxID=1366 RepID=UPI0014367025|nr:hypothetical protein [Lactococcus raffinolactis]QIW60386.1 hypothetical protein GU333_04300 [Lactococcus raffinolactis]